MRNMENKHVVYHGSSVQGIVKLEPFKCKHDKAYVYATRDYWVMLFFSAKGQGKFDGWIDTDENGIITFYEARPNAFKERFSGKTSYCYKLPSDTFTNATEDPIEVVSETAVEVLSCEEIKDVGEEFGKLIKEKQLNVVPYDTSEQNTAKICEKYILKVLTKKGFFQGRNFRQKEWAVKYYSDLIQNFQNQSER